MLRQNFTREIEFYQFCRQRLHRQFLALKKNDLQALAVKEEQQKSTFINRALSKLRH